MHRPLEGMGCDANKIWKEYDNSSSMSAANQQDRQKGSTMRKPVFWNKIIVFEVNISLKNEEQIASCCILKLEKH